MRKIAIVICVTITLIDVFFVINMFITPSNKVQEFSVEAWQNEPTKRFRIVDDLLEKYTLIGLNRDEIIILLGNPRNDVNPSYNCIVDSILNQPNSELMMLDLAKERFMFYYSI